MTRMRHNDWLPQRTDNVNNPASIQRVDHRTDQPLETLLAVRHRSDVSLSDRTAGCLHSEHFLNRKWRTDFKLGNCYTSTPPSELSQWYSGLPRPLSVAPNKGVVGKCCLDDYDSGQDSARGIFRGPGYPLSHHSSIAHNKRRHRKSCDNVRSPEVYPHKNAEIQVFANAVFCY